LSLSNVFYIINISGIVTMKLIRITMDEDLLRKVDEIIKKKKITRSIFIRESIVYYLKRKRILEMEKKHREGYEKKPVLQDEFFKWENEQDWVD